MIEDVDRRLEQWIASVLGPLQVTFVPPVATVNRPTVSVYLLAVFHVPVGRPMRNEPPIKIVLRYLMTPMAEDPLEAHRLLSQLLLAAVGNAEWEVESDPLPAPAWLGLGLGIRPALLLRVPVRQERPVKVVPRVTSTLVIHHSPLGSLTGRIVGPGGVSIMGALVEVPGLSVSTRTDSNGHFVFPSIPLLPRVKALRVNARGRSVQVDLDRPGKPDNRLTIELKESEIRYGYVLSRSRRLRGGNPIPLARDTRPTRSCNATTW